jgi:tellurite resistance protein TerC
MIDRFVYLSFGLSVVLVFVGAKFIYSGLFGKFPLYVSLPFIAAAVTISILASLWKARGGGQKVAEEKEQRSST